MDTDVTVEQFIQAVEEIEVENQQFRLEFLLNHPGSNTASYERPTDAPFWCAQFFVTKLNEVRRKEAANGQSRSR